MKFLIRIYEVLEANQPYVLRLLRKLYPIGRPAAPVPGRVEDMPFSAWRAMQQERPKHRKFQLQF